ncbi:MAG: M1 family metallopeptidase, partial [Bacteroidota bacterium]|nr:M1 family metallopeptidase [Bacteroidota bacterium]
MKNIFVFITVLFSFISVFATNHRDSIDVIHYKINLSSVDFSSKKIKANTIVTFTPNFDNTKTLKLDLIGLKVDKIILTNSKLKSWSQNDSLIILNFKNNLSKKDTVSVSIFYYGSPKKDAYWGGFYFSSKDAFNMGVGMASVPHSFGRVWFPCNDNFTDKATYEYFISVDEKYTAVCGGILQNVKTSSKNNKKINTYYWKQNKAIPTYLASVNIGEYGVIKDVYDGLENNFPIEVYAYKNNVENTEKSIVNLNKAVRIFENLFGPYSWDKIGYSQVSFKSGAMEHAENIAMSSYAFNGTLRNETLLYHELAHSWFGNLVTCKTAGDMWLNEGWACYSEALFLENMYGDKKFVDYNRKRHSLVLLLAHRKDKGYRSLAYMDLDFTYGTTIYKKGADVVHTLRYYLGDSLFFSAVKSYLKKYAFSTASSEDLKNTFSQHTGVNLSDFFDFWVYSSGFPFFEITNWKANNEGANYNVSVNISQRVVGGNKLANSNRVEIFFMDSDFNTVKRTFTFSGKSATQSFSVPFKPVLVMADLNEHIADATIDQSLIINETNTYSFKECFFETDVTNISAKSFLRVTCNFIEPENTESETFILQKKYYWTVEGIWNKEFEATGKFYTSRFMDKDFNKISAKNKIILVYRESSQKKWEQVNVTLKKNFLQTKLQTGQYALSI